MNNYLDLLKDSPLFKGLREENLLSLLSCMDAQKESFSKESVIFAAGEKIDRLGIVLTGRVDTVYEDVLGSRSILDTILPGQLFGDAFSCAPQENLPINVMALTDCEVLLIETERILHSCSVACDQRHQIIENLVHLLAQKYVEQNRKMMHLSGRTTRRKLLSYLYQQSKQNKGSAFLIPFTQQELADYLFVERSGLSTELNRLKKEGLLEQQGASFKLHIAPCIGNDCALNL